MMNAQPIAIAGTGLVTSVGLSAPAACAAIRAKLSNPTETHFMGNDGAWIMAHQVPLEAPWRGRTRLARMAEMAITKCLAPLPRSDWPGIPLLLCVAERERPGRLDGLDEPLLTVIEQALGLQFAAGTLIIPQGRVSALIALREARRRLAEPATTRVLVVATDSLLTWPTLSVYQAGARLLSQDNSNGFMPGEAAGALLLTRPGAAPALCCTGLGLAREPAPIAAETPLRAEGLTTAIRAALGEAGRGLHALDYRITDLAGEQYYFKEAALALTRILRERKETFDLWHPAESIGETGAAAGLAMLAVADAAARKAYAPGPGLLAHCANDAGQRAAAVLRYEVH